MYISIIYVLLGNDCLIRVYIARDITIICCYFSQELIMTTLSTRILLRYYAQNYTGIIGWSLVDSHGQICFTKFAVPRITAP